jgi:hypothetical protein
MNITAATNGTRAFFMMYLDDSATLPAASTVGSVF